MRAFWDLIEVTDRAAILALDKVDGLLKRGKFRTRVEKAVEHVRPAQKAITFDA